MDRSLLENEISKRKIDNIMQAVSKIRDRNDILSNIFYQTEGKRILDLEKE
jgi:hypothetical protein